jgi:hypothetical protein
MKDATSPQTEATTLRLHQTAERATAYLTMLLDLSWELRATLPAEVDQAVIALNTWLIREQSPAFPPPPAQVGRRARAGESGPQA